MNRFFVWGSVPPEAGGPAPLYQYNTQHHPGDVEFATELDSDLRLLSDFLKVGLFHYGPPLWRLGLTSDYQTLRYDGIADEQRKQIWKAIFDKCVIRTLEPGATIFRVRKGENLPPALPAEFDTPPLGVTTCGRYESERLPIFYGADDIETCLHESRVTLSDWIALATFTPARPLKLLDLAGDIDDSSARTGFDRVDILMRRLAFVGSEDYDLCRELATEIHALGLDGFYFTSYFAQAHRKGLRNIALFGHPAGARHLKLVSVNRLILTAAEYDFRFGPSNDTSLPIAPEEVEAISSKMLQTSGHQKEAIKDAMIEAANELAALIARKSDGPR